MRIDPAAKIIEQALEKHKNKEIVNMGGPDKTERSIIQERIELFERIKNRIAMLLEERAVLAKTTANRDAEIVEELKQLGYKKSRPRKAGTIKRTKSPKEGQS